MNGMGKKILLADDSITIQKVIELTFSDEDFEVVTVGNGRLALERLAEVRPDIVLCDIIMPEKDGYEVCEQIKSSPSTGHIPVLLLTGAFEPFDQERASRAGYDGSLAKPFEPETLIAKVKELLAKAPRPLAASPGPTGPMPAAVPDLAKPPARPETPIAVAAARTVAPPTPAASFIPDEPFSGLDADAFEAPPTPARPPAARPAPALAPISFEESDTLSGSPAEGGEDNAATVIYRPSESPWEGGSGAPEPDAPEPPAPPRPGAPEPAAPAGAGQEPGFDAVLEEDLDFGPGDYGTTAPPRSTGGADISEAFSTNAGTMPPVGEVEEGTSGPFAALVRGETAEPIETSAASTAEFPKSAAVEEDLLEAEPMPPTEVPSRPIFEEPASPFVPPPRPPAPRPEPPAGAARTLLDPARPPELRPAPPPRAAEPAAPAVPPRMPPAPTPPVVRPAPVLAEPPKPAAPPRTLLDAAPPRPESAPRAAAVQPEPPARPSEAAGVAVPAEMVEKIAQRVIAQISEKIVREVAWEVIPDLAEALIKREIERLKAELAKL